VDTVKLVCANCHADGMLSGASAGDNQINLKLQLERRYERSYDGKPGRISIRTPALRPAIRTSVRTSIVIARARVRPRTRHARSMRSRSGTTRRAALRLLHQTKAVPFWERSRRAAIPRISARRA